ncbi:MAG: hypothetical protein K2X69_04890, partial [Silvanigrellaceae bacterium]|nr:hypothetical protein [Silvanigrellaceae bacterium]
KTISEIRQRFLNDFTSHSSIQDLKKQYLYCLFALSLNKMRFSDENRRFILMTIESLIELLG